MKVIDLLNKIANGEEAPKKIKYNNETFTIREEKDDYVSEKNLFTDRYSLLDLNEEVEIIEEDKKIKRIQSCGDNLYSEYIGQWLVNKENYTEYDELLMNKINEIIDKLNEMEKE